MCCVEPQPLEDVEELGQQVHEDGDCGFRLAASSRVDLGSVGGIVCRVKMLFPCIVE